MAQRRIILATGNAHKVRELQEIVGAPSEVTALGALLAERGAALPHVVEDAETFVGNAAKKVDAAVAALLEAKVAVREDDVVLADDSGIVVDALAQPGMADAHVHGRPGVRSARFARDAGTGSGDAANNALLLLLLGAVPLELRAARYVAALVAERPWRAGGTRERREAIGTVEGRIAFDARGAGGFGYDPLFLVEDGPPALHGRRMAELGAEEKHAISHRGRAARALLDALSRER